MKGAKKQENPNKIKTSSGIWKFHNYILTLLYESKKGDSMGLNIFMSKLDKRIVKLLAETPVFHELSKRELKKVKKIVHINDYKADQIIFRKSDPGLGMHIILEGSVEIIVKKDNKEAVVLAELGETNFFGDVSLLDESLRTADVIAREDTTLVELYR